jgi:hypothetical protein
VSEWYREKKKVVASFAFAFVLGVVVDDGLFAQNALEF